MKPKKEYKKHSPRSNEEDMQRGISSRKMKNRKVKYKHRNHWLEADDDYESWEFKSEEE